MPPFETIDRRRRRGWEFVLVGGVLLVVLVGVTLAVNKVRTAAARTSDL
jgi:hypothetical protein